MRSGFGIVWVLLLSGSLAGCATGGRSLSGTADPAPTAALAVERFLVAARGYDLDGMARLFGTWNGSIADTSGGLRCGFRRFGSWFGIGERCVSPQEIEIRMNAIAEFLQFESFRIVGERAVPGREHPTTRVGVSLTRGSSTIPDVPFLAVQGRDGRWRVQEIDLERISRGGS